MCRDYNRCTLPSNVGGEGIVHLTQVQEGHVFAEISDDQKWIDFYNDKNERDGHSFVAKMCFPEELKDIPEKDVKKERKDLRQIAKIAHLGFNYNGSAKAMSIGCNIPLEQAQKVYDKYFETFSGIDAYFKRQKKFVWDNGYILMTPITGMRSYVYNFKTLKDIERRLNSDPSYWQMYREAKKSKNVDWEIISKDGYSSLRNLVAEEFGMGMDINLMSENIYTDPSKSKDTYLLNKETIIVLVVKYFQKERKNIESRSVNYPCQGTAATMLKIAISRYFNHILNNNLFGKVKIVNAVHDEGLVECPREIKEQEMEALREAFDFAADIFCRKVKLTADPEYADYWIH